MQVALIDYGAGNMASVVKGLRAAGAEVSIALKASDLASSRAVVIPGVGHFAATAALDDRWRAAISERMNAGAAILGICLGMQWLFEGSEEAPDLPGLGAISGTCVRFREKTSGVFSGRHEIPEQNRTEKRRRVSFPLEKTPDVFLFLKVPHVGWNTLEGARGRLLAGIPAGAYAYFTHAFAAPVTDATAATTTHGMTFASVVERGRIFGTQWHPEKSGETGLQVLRNFVAIASEAR